MKKPHREHAFMVRPLIFGVALVLAIPCSVSLAQEVAPITASGLNTTVSGPITLPSGETQFDITGGTRPGGGGNLFHSFGNFDVPNNNIANFLNNSGLATSNILGRVTGGNVSDIFGTIQTTGFGNANLFLMNPEGFLFGPNATVNVGGMVAFTSADYLRLADNARFNAIPHTGPDLLLSVAPVAAFGFLGSYPGAITVQGSQLSVTDGTGISLVGGNITVQAGTLTAPSGEINLVSVNKPSHSKVGGEVVVTGAGQESGFNPTGFKSLGTINLSQGSTIATSGTAGSGFADGTPGGKILIRGGQFILDASEMNALTPKVPVGVAVGSIEVTAKHVALSNHSSVDTSTNSISGNPAGDITFNVGTFSATDSAISATVQDGGQGGAVTIQGLQGEGASAHSVSLTNTTVSTVSAGLPGFPEPGNTHGGPIVIRADTIELTQSHFNTLSFENIGGPITLVAKHRIESHDSSFSSNSFFGSGGLVVFTAGKSINLTNTGVSTRSSSGLNGGSITLSAPRISLSGTGLDATSNGAGHGGTISLTGKNAVSLTNGTVLSADNTLNFPDPGSFFNANGGIINIDGGARFISQQSTISAKSVQHGDGGTINVEAKQVGLTDTQLTTSVSGGPQTVAGTITIDANAVKVKNSQILSTTTEGQGGTINITSHNRHPVVNSVIDATSQFGTDGTVTIERR